MIKKYVIFTFVDYEKAFGSVEHSTVLNSLWEQGISKNYAKVIEKIYDNRTAIINRDYLNHLLLWYVDSIMFIGAKKIKIQKIDVLSSNFDQDFFFVFALVWKWTFS